MFNMKNVGDLVTKKAYKAAFICKKHSPEILLVVGIVGVGASIVTACKATLKAQDVVLNAKEEIESVHNVRDAYIDKVDDKGLAVYTEKDEQKDLATIYIQSGVQLAKYYAIPVALAVASVGCLVGSHNIMQKRSVAILAAYKAVQETFDEYRKRVADEYGEEKEYQIRRGIKATDVVKTITDENGEEQTVVETECTDPNKYSAYSMFFDECNPRWSPNAEYNLMFIKHQQNYANDMLRARGHLFLNEVYDMLGFERTSAGAVVGWAIGKDNDNYVDFGIFDRTNGRARDFVNGYEKSVLLDFNIDGVIYDLL